MKPYLIPLLTLLASVAHAQVTWTNPAVDEPQAISIGSNWSTSVKPPAGSAVIIGVSSWLGFDESLTVSSLTFSPGVISDFVPLDSQSVTIGSGGLSFGAGSSAGFDLTVISSANSTWNIGGASAAFRSVLDITAGTVSLNLSNGGSITIANSNNPVWGGTLAISGTGSFSVSATAFLAANLDNVTINGSAVMQSGDQLVPVAPIPEPAGIAGLAGGAILFCALVRRRRG